MFTNSYLTVEIDKSILSYEEQVYLPVYPASYLQKNNADGIYTALVHVINKSQFEPMYVLCIDCYNTQGDLCEKLIEEPIRIAPLEASRFVVNTELSGKGYGANVILKWGVKKLDRKPDIFIEMSLNTPVRKFSITDRGKIVSDQDEILDRRPL